MHLTNEKIKSTGLTIEEIKDIKEKYLNCVAGCEMPIIEEIWDDYMIRENVRKNEGVELISNEYRKNVVGIKPFIRLTWDDLMMVEDGKFRTVTNEGSYQLEDFEFCLVNEMQGGVKFLMDATDDVFEVFNKLGEIERLGGCLFEHWYFCHPLDMKRIDKKVIEILSKEYKGCKLKNMIDLYLNPKTDYPLAMATDVLSPLHIFH